MYSPSTVGISAGQHQGYFPTQQQYPVAAGPLANKKYVSPQYNNYRPKSAFYDDNSYAASSFAQSAGTVNSSSSHSLSSMGNISNPKRYTRARSYSTSSSQHLQSSAASVHSVSQPSLNVAPAPDRYHRRKSMVSLQPEPAASSLAPSAAAASAANHAHSQSASSINTSNTPTSTASSASNSTSSSYAMSNPSPSTRATNTPMSSNSVPSSPVPNETKQPLYKHQHNTGSVSAFSSSSSSKKEFSSLSSVSSVGSDGKFNSFSNDFLY